MRSLIVSVLLFSACLVKCDYSEALSQELVKYSAATYCCGTLGHGCENWSCDVCKELPYLNTTVLYNKTGDINGFVGFDAKNDDIIVAIAGTDPLSIKDWIDDINFIKVDYPCPAPLKCQAHKGFLSSFDTIRVQMEDAIRKYWTLSPTASVYVTGHSLGAAIALHATVHVIMKMPYVKFAASYVFGLPRTGNSDFATWVSKTMIEKGTLFHVTHHRDPVPHLPPSSFGFHHVGGEIYYNEPNTDYTVCDGTGEDAMCADQFYAAVNVLDHLSYMNFSFTTNYITCKI